MGIWSVHLLEPSRLQLTLHAKFRQGTQVQPDFDGALVDQRTCAGLPTPSQPSLEAEKYYKYSVEAILCYYSY